MKARRTRLVLMALAATSATLLGGALPATAVVDSQAGTTTAAAPTTATARVQLLTLECIETEDFGFAGDEPYIKVNGHYVWGAPDSVDDGGQVAVNRIVNEGDTVSLYDSDSPDADDLIGSDIVHGSRGNLIFRGDGAHYVLNYGPSPR